MSLNLSHYLTAGYGADQILQFVEKAFPNIAKATKQARQTGKSAEQIVKMLASLDAKQLKKADKNAERLNFDNPLERANYAARVQENNQLLQAAKVGGGALAGAAALGALPFARQALSPGAISTEQIAAQKPLTPYQSTIAPSIREGVPSTNFQPGPTLKSQELQSVQTQIRPTAQPQPQESTSPSSIQASVPSQPPIVKSSQILQDMGLTEKITNLFKAGNNPEQISAGVELSLTPGQKNYLQNKIKSGEAKPIQEMVQDFLNETKGGQRVEAAQKIEKVTPEQKVAISERLVSGEKAKPLPEMLQQAQKDIQESKGSPESIQKGSVVSTPDGLVGEVHDVRKKEALVKDDSGKLHKVKVDDLEPIPKEWENIHVDLSKVPESSRSAALNFVAPTPDRKSVIIRFFEGHKPILYQYSRKDGQPFTEEMLQSLYEEMDAPIGEGFKFGGAWSPTGKSRGTSVFHNLNKQSQNIEDEEENPEKPLIFTKIPIKYEHGFMTAYHEQLSKAEKKFNEYYHPTKRKKKK